jgi:hypothetical protein
MAVTFRPDPTETETESAVERGPLSESGGIPAEALAAVCVCELEAHWLEIRGRALAPLHASALVTTAEDRREFLRGAEMLRFHGERAMRGRSPQPQQLVVVDALAAGRARNAVLLPRRSSKSTTLIAIALGRAEARDDYRVGILTMTSGKAGRSRFAKDVAPAVERSGTACKIVRGAGQERIEFPGGGFVQWLSSIDDLRGEAFDLIVLDEAGEADEQKVQDTLAAALPTLDTRPGAQIVAAGTAGKFRSGNLLWDWLSLARAGRGGIVEYAIPDTVQDEDFETWEQVEPLIMAAHPGIGTLTTAAAVRGNYETLPRAVFAAEYGGIFGDVGGTTALFDPLKWARTGVDGALPAPPDGFRLAFAAHPDSLSTSIVAAWRDEQGRAVPLLLEHLPGIDRAAPVLLRYARRFKTPIVFDAAQQANALIVEALGRATPRPKLEPKQFGQVKQAATLIVDEVDRENVVHYREQVALTEAIHKAIKRKAGDRGWLLGRHPKTPDDDITSAEAWSLAQLAFDADDKPRRPLRSRVAS